MLDEQAFQKFRVNVKKVWSELQHRAASISIYKIYSRSM